MSRIWADATLAAALFAVDPRTGGIVLHALPGPVRDRFLALLGGKMKLRRLPLHAADDRLLGGLDLAATLQTGRPIAARGLLAEADGGGVVLAMAERVPAATAARLGAALDTGEVVAERDGLTLRSPAAIGVVALDEGIGEDERPAPALLDRLAFLVDLSGISLAEAAPGDPSDVRAAQALLPSVTMPDHALAALCETAAALGVPSMRALLLAARAARAAAALGGRCVVAEADVVAAARLVLAPRATTAAIEPPAPAPDQPGDDAPPAAPDQPGDDADHQAQGQDRPLGDLVLAAARAAIPAGLLAQLLPGGGKTPRAPTAGRAGAAQLSVRRGRPIGARRGELSAGARLNLVETLRAAAPWQPLRRRALAEAARPLANRPVIVTKDDFRITRFRQRSETTTIFLVDASGSAALNRLAEAKGAVELVLADCYVRRDQVALIAFRGIAAELLLPPTPSLVRARRSLAGLPGGGGTPLATGIDAAAALADAVRRKGRTPVVILLSDGRANIARDGSASRPRGEADALDAGRRLAIAGITCMVVDTSPRPTPQARRLADTMAARYLPLPYADAEAMARAVRAIPPHD